MTPVLMSLSAMLMGMFAMVMFVILSLVYVFVLLVFVVCCFMIMSMCVIVRMGNKLMLAGGVVLPGMVLHSCLLCDTTSLKNAFSRILYLFRARIQLLWRSIRL